MPASLNITIGIYPVRPAGDPDVGKVQYEAQDAHDVETCIGQLQSLIKMLEDGDPTSLKFGQILFFVNRPDRPLAL